MTIRSAAARDGARIGALTGLVEAVAVARWDVLMDDVTPARVGEAAAWGVAIVGIEAALGAVLCVLARGSVRIAVLLWAVAVAAARAGVHDRFEPWSLVALPLALALTWRRLPRLDGLVALALAVPALWGRVPNYTVDLAGRLEFLAPGAVLAVLAALLPTRLLPLVAAAPLAFALPGLSRARAADDRRPNVLFVLVDTLRQDHVGPWAGQGVEKTVSRLAAEGVRFDDAITVIPKTTQSVAAIQTGRYPIHDGVRNLKDTLAADQVTLAERFAAAGYRTAAFVHNGWIMRGRGFEQGFQQFWSWFEIERPYGPLRYTGALTALDAVTLRRIQPFDGDVDARVATDRTIAWLARNDGPFFAYVHYFDPHWPYRPPGVDSACMVNDIDQTKWSRGKMMFDNPLPESENERARQLYAGEVDHVQEQVGRLVDWLDASGLADNTIVVFTADHGHHLGEHHYWFHHGEFLWEQGLDIPLVMRWPGHLEAGRVVTGQTRSIDIAPTVLGLVGLPADGMDGVDRLANGPAPTALIETDSMAWGKANKRRYLKGVLGKQRGIRTDRWKLIFTPKDGGGIWELYDRSVDPEEAHDLVADGTAPPEETLALVRTLGEMLPAKERTSLEKLGARFDVVPTPTVATEGGTPEDAEQEMDPSDLQMLRSLGYVE